jgi:hypothetical protein
MVSEGEYDDPFGRAIAKAFAALSNTSSEQEALGAVASALGSVEQDDDQSVTPSEDDVSITDAIEAEARRHAMVAKKQANLKETPQAKKKFKLKPS